MSVDAYLRALSPDRRAALERLRRLVHAEAGEVEEAIRVRVPAFRYRGRPLVSMGAARDHLAFYVMYGGALEAHARSLAGFDVTNKAVRFTPDHPLPERVVRAIVRHRVGEIEARR